MPGLRRQGLREHKAMIPFLMVRQACMFLITPLATWGALCLFGAPSGCEACITDVRVLIIGSHQVGPGYWISVESYYIENMLEFNGIPYDFFDILANDLVQTDLDPYDAVILEGYALRWHATGTERTLIANNMKNGNIVALVGLIHGEFTQLNATVYDAIDVSVDGLANGEGNISLGAGATIIYDFEGDEGFIISGGYGGKHIGMAVNSVGRWTYIDAGTGSSSYCAERVAGFEFALETWMKSAFGLDARVTMPTVSLYFSDTQTTAYPRDQQLMDFIAGNKRRIRASGFLVTDNSAYQGSDTTLQNDEQTISEWGSMSLHGKDHGSVGAEGENRDFERQYNDMNIAVSFLAEHFSRYKAIKGCPNNSWNEATLHAMYCNYVPYHSASIRSGPSYKALYKSVIEASDEYEREKIFARGSHAGLRYYPLYHSDSTGQAWIYSVDWYYCFRSDHDPQDVPRILREYTVDWWTPILTATHFWSPDGGAQLDPIGWMAVMEELMNAVDHDSHPWRRWVDSYDYAQNIERFDKNLTVNSITVSDDVISFDITAGLPVKFLTLKTDKTGYLVQSVTINGLDHCYFGSDHVHLPEIDGNAVIVVTLTSQDDAVPHVTHIDPCAVVESAKCVSGRLELTLSGEFDAVARIAGSGKVFLPGTTTVFVDRTEEFRVDVSTFDQCDQVDLSITPSSGSVKATVTEWDPPDSTYRKWLESASDACVCAEHVMGSLEPNGGYIVRLDGCVIDSCTADTSGEITFACSLACSCRTVEVLADTAGTAAIPHHAPVDDGQSITELFVSCRPNPSSSGTTIHYGLPRESHIVLSVYSVGGQLVCRLAQTDQPAGRHYAFWDGLDARGHTVPPGLYFCRLETRLGTLTGKFVVVR